MTAKKCIAILLYALYAIAMTLFLIFGGGASEWAIGLADDKLNKTEITDVTVDIAPDTELLAGTYHTAQFTAKGKFRGDAELQLTSLDPEYFTIANNGRMYANMNFEGDETNVRVKVTSKRDKDFEKIVTFRFVKKYPENFNVFCFIKGYGTNAGTLYLDVPTYVGSDVEKTDKGKYNVKAYELEYDEEYFVVNQDKTLTPIKTTEDGKTVSFTVRYANGASATMSGIRIVENDKFATEIDDMRIGNIPIDECEIGTNESIWLYLCNGGEKIATDYTISFEDESDVQKSLSGTIVFKSAGDKKVRITLPNGFTKEFTLKVRNKIAAPTVSDSDIAQSHVIELLDTDVKSLKLTYPSGVTYKEIKCEYDPEIVSVVYTPTTITITPKNVGSTEFKIVIDDGYEHIEDVYTLRVEHNKSLVVWAAKNVEIFVAKILGHSTLFVVLAILSMNMFKYIEINNPLKRFILYTMTALPIGVITEFVQHYMPTRHGKVEDVLIDMAAFFIGTAIVLSVRFVSLCVRKIAK